MQPVAYAYNFQVNRFNVETPFSLLLARYHPKPATIASPTALPKNVDSATNPVDVEQRILANLATMCTSISGTFAQRKSRHKRYFDKNVGSLPGFKAGQMMYLNQPPLTILSADCQNSARYSKLMTRTTGPFKVLEIRDPVLTIDENCIANSVSIDRAKPVASQHSNRFLKKKN